MGMDWLLTVPLLLIEILLVMKLEGDDFNSRAWTLGFGPALMIVSGYYGELVVTGDLTPRWVIALPTLFPSAESASSSTKSLTRSPASSISCNERVHETARLAPFQIFQ